MGRRNQSEFEALKAQAVVSRTYALRNLRRRTALGFDLHAGVSDQVYGGSESETPEGREAVGLTRGQVLTFGGRPIDAFYYSTCGGHTADGVEAFRAASRPYLRSFADVDEHGQAYCRISPRYRWREEWTGDALRMTLRRTLPTTLGVGADRASEVRDVWVAQRTASGRVGRLGITLPARHALVGRSPAWWPKAAERGTAWACASGELWAAHAPARTTSAFSRRIFPARRYSALTRRVA
jgi:stage II sporulation protein D